MKKMILSLAAMAALISCVEEKGLEPQNPAGNQVVIKATTTLATKTVLGNELPEDGISVRWEDTDVIKVFLKDSDSGTASADFDAVDVDGVNADFTGEFAEEEFEHFNVNEVTDAYAIYPSSSVSEGEITHTLAEEQNGNITSGMNLSYAALNADEVLNGTATSATFRNALALIQITVPADVMYVSLSTGVMGDALVGTATYTYSDGNLIGSISGSKRTVTLKDGDAPLAAGTYSLLVFPGTHTDNTLTLTMEGTDGAVYKKSLNDIQFLASQCYTIDLTTLSYLGVEEDIYFDPRGGTLVIPIMTTESYEYEVEVTMSEPTDPAWISHVATRSFHKDEIEFSIAANNTPKVRDAEIKVSIEGVGTKTFSVSQNGYEAALTKQYIESYENQGKLYTGKMTISFSDDFKKGTYKVTEFLTSTNQNHITLSYTFYAEYADHKLTLKKDDYIAGHYGSVIRDIVLDVSADFKTITSNTIQHNDNDSFKILNYKAIESLGPAVPTDTERTVIGEYNESWTIGGTKNNNALGMVVSASDEAAFGRLKVTMLKDGIKKLTSYADISDDGKTLTVHSAGVKHDSYGVANGDIVLSYSDGTFTSSGQISFGSTTLTDYTATNKEPEEEQGIDANSLVGEYDETFVDFTLSEHNGTMTISLSGKDITVRMLSYKTSVDYYLQCPAELSADGKTLTVKSKGVDYIGGGGKFQEDIVLNINISDQKITLSTNKIFSHQYGSLSSYVATKRN